MHKQVKQISLKVTRENYTQTQQPLNQSNCNNILYYTKLVEQNPNGKRLTDEKEKKAPLAFGE